MLIVVKMLHFYNKKIIILFFLTYSLYHNIYFFCLYDKNYNFICFLYYKKRVLSSTLFMHNFVFQFFILTVLHVLHIHDPDL